MKKNDKEAEAKHVGLPEALPKLSLDPGQVTPSRRGWATPGLEADVSQRAAGLTRYLTPSPGATLTAADPDFKPALSGAVREGAPEVFIPDPHLFVLSLS